MAQQAELLRKLDKLPPKYISEVINFIGYLQHKAQQEENVNELEQETHKMVNSLSKDDNEKICLTKEIIAEMEKNSPTLHKLTGILHTDMTIDEIRMARMAKHL